MTNIIPPPSVPHNVTLLHISMVLNPKYRTSTFEPYLFACIFVTSLFLTVGSRQYPEQEPKQPPRPGKDGQSSFSDRSVRCQGDFLDQCVRDSFLQKSRLYGSHLGCTEAAASGLVLQHEDMLARDPQWADSTLGSRPSK